VLLVQSLTFGFKTLVVIFIFLTLKFAYKKKKNIEYEKRAQPSNPLGGGRTSKLKCTSSKWNY